MKLFVVILLGFPINSYATNYATQSINNTLQEFIPASQNLNLNLKNTSIKEVLSTIEKNSDYVFILSNNASSELNRKIDLNTISKSVPEILEIIASKSELKYEIINRQVVVYKGEKEKPEQKSVSKPLPYEFKGRVIDANGLPLIGATVKVKDETQGTTTDMNGEFNIKLEAKSEKVVFEISFIGFKTQEVTLFNGKNSTIMMEEEVAEIGEVVVTGIFNRASGNFTGSATTISSQDIMKVGNQNILQSLKNIDPTLQFGDNLLLGSDPNSLPNLSMRGISSLPIEDGINIRSEYGNQPNQPLFILDGFETSLATIVDMDMNRIESVTILKDASAKALYGSKAANGVIVIETKKLQGNQQRVTYNGGLSLEIPDLTSYNLTNSLEKLDVELADGRYSSTDLASHLSGLALYNERKKKALEGLNTYWLAKPLRTGVGHKHNLSIELGDSKSLRANIDFTYNLISGAMKGSDRQNISTSANISYRTKNVIFRNVLTYLSNNSYDSPYGAFQSYANMNPYWEANDSEGNVLRWADERAGIPNPMHDAVIGTYLNRKYTQFTDNLYAEWNVSEALKAILRVGVTMNKSTGDEFYPATHSKFTVGGSTNNLENRGRYTLENGQKVLKSGDLNVRYSKTLGVHYFFVNGGVFVSESDAFSYSHTAEGFSNTSVADITFARRYLENSKPSGYSTLNREASFLLASSYVYANKYMLDATLRQSASSLYGSNNRWASSWSLGMGWNMHKELFLKSFDSLQQLKLRASLGVTGNQNFNTNAAIPTYRYYSGIVYGQQTGAYLGNMPNPDLKWEQKMDYNVGADLRVYGLNLSLDVYRSDTKNMLTDLTIPTSTGFNVVKDNLGLVRNYGVELKLGYNIYQNKDGFFSLFGAIATNKNRIVRLSESLKAYNEKIRENTASTSNAASRPVILYEDGMSMTTIWAVPSAGIDPGRGTEIFIKQDGSYTYEYDPTDLRPSGDYTPKYRGNFGFNAEYKGIGMNLTLTFQAGGQIYNSTLVEKVENADIEYNVDRRLAEGRWRNPGDITRFKKYNNSRRTRPTSRFVQDRDDLNISSVSLYYNVPAKCYKAIHLQHLRVALHANELATFSSVQVERGTSYPFTRKLSFSLMATF